jgi:hypothetical protein
MARADVQRKRIAQRETAENRRNLGRDGSATGTGARSSTKTGATIDATIGRRPTRA